MKKLICALIACSNLIWCIGSMSNAVQAAEVTQSPNIASEIRGDINGDKVITILDVIMLQKWILGIGSLPNWQNADLDDNGTVDVFDLSLLKRKLIADHEENSAMLLDHTVVHRKWTHICEEYYDGYICVTSSPSELWDVMRSVRPYITEEDYSIVEETKDLYEDQSIIVMFCPAGASTRRIEVDSISVDHGVLTVATTTRDFSYGSPDMRSECILIAVKKELTDGVQDVILNDHFEELDSIWPSRGSNKSESDN